MVACQCSTRRSSAQAPSSPGPTRQRTFTASRESMSLRPSSSSLARMSPPFRATITTRRQATSGPPCPTRRDPLPADAVLRILQRDSALSQLLADAIGPSEVLRLARLLSLGDQALHLGREPRVAVPQHVEVSVDVGQHTE